MNGGAIGGAPEAGYCLPPKVARYMALTGNLLTAEQMHQYNMVCKVAPGGQAGGRRVISVARDRAKATDPLGLRCVQKGAAKDL